MGSESSTTPLDAGPVYRLPATAAVACMLALIALFISARGLFALPFFALIILTTYVTRVRLESRAITWAVRGVLFAIVTALIFTSQGSGIRGHWLINPDYSIGFGQLCAAELVVQCWRRRPTGGEKGFSIILLSGLVFISGCNTNDVRFIRWLAPAYVLMLALLLRDYRPWRSPRAGKPRRSALPLSVACLAAALSIGGAIHWTFYNYQNQITMLFIQLLREYPSRNVGGISDTPVLGATSDLRGTGTRVLLINGEFEGGHLRCMAFDTYAHATWTPTMDKRQKPEPVPAIQADPRARRITIVRLVNDFSWILAPLHCTAIVPAGDRTIEWSPSNGGPMRTTVWTTPPYQYDVLLSSDQYHQGLLCYPLPDALLERCRIVPPEIEPGVRKLAQDIGGGSITDPLARVRAVEKYLQENYTYATTMDPGRGDPVSSFLLRVKKGHCEYFASSAVVLLRCLGVPARYVTGYHAHEWNASNRMSVRDSDAHAWAESWIDGIGWITVEATPASGMPSLSQVAWWIRFWDWITDTAEWLMAEIGGMGWAIVPWIAGTALLGFLAVRLLRMLVSRRRQTPALPQFAYYSPNPALDEMAQQFERHLRQRGAPCPSSIPWEEHLLALKQAEPAVSNPALNKDLAEKFLMHYNAVRFGSPNDEKALAELGELLRKMEQ